MPQGGGGGGGGGLTTFDRLLSPNQGRFALIKVKSPTSPRGGGGGSRNNDRRINCSVLAFECTSNLTAFLACLMLQCTTLGE